MRGLGRRVRGLGVVVHVDVPQHGCLDVRAGEDDRRTREDDAANASADADGGDRAMEDKRMNEDSNLAASRGHRW